MTCAEFELLNPWTCSLTEKACGWRHLESCQSCKDSVHNKLRGAIDKISDEDILLTTVKAFLDKEEIAAAQQFDKEL
jgi:hypothetical protein